MPQSTPTETVIESARTLGEWIPACDILPEQLETVLITDGAHHFIGFVSFDGRWHLGPYHPAPDGFVTHWMPLPAPPSSVT